MELWLFNLSPIISSSLNLSSIISSSLRGYTFQALIFFTGCAILNDRKNIVGVSSSIQTKSALLFMRSSCATFIEVMILSILCQIISVKMGYNLSIRSQTTYMNCFPEKRNLNQVSNQRKPLFPGGRNLFGYLILEDKTIRKIFLIPTPRR